ncbi:MAG: hypothetical protein ABI912_08685 [Actinomycetota bacterium]
MPNDSNERSAISRFARPAALVAAGLLAGGIAASTMSASAQTSDTPSASSSAAAPAPAAPKDLDSATPVRSDETLVSGSNLAKARAAALKAVPGGTIIRVETDSGPADYEAHMKKADGSRVTVLFDANFNVTSVATGMGGGPGGGGHRGNDGDADDATSSTATTSTAPTGTA